MHARAMMPLMSLAAQTHGPPGKTVCVIGAGAAGLASARAMRAAGLLPTVLEQRSSVGGVWNREAGAVAVCENPVYDGLHTNLPKELMQFRDFPFDRSLPSFVGHADVQRYLEAYAEHHRIHADLRLRTRVRRVWRDEPSGEWVVQSERLGDSAAGGSAGAGTAAPTEERFSAVVVANGHFAAPIVPSLAGRDAFEAAGGRVVHSSAYRRPGELFADADAAGKRVLVVGSGPSGTDISLEFAMAGALVTLSVRAGPAGWPATRDELISLERGVESLGADRRARFAGGGSSAPLDVVVLATGYDYAFPFLESRYARVHGGDDDGEKRVTPLYRQLFHVDEPSLAFVGLPFKVVPFPLCEAQAALVARVITGEATLPPRSERRARADADLAELRSRGGRNLHMLGGAQWEYTRELLREARLPVPEARLRLLERVNAEVSERRRRLPRTYRESQYTIRVDEADLERGGSFSVAHPTHPFADHGAAGMEPAADSTSAAVAEEGECAQSSRESAAAGEGVV